MDPPFTRLVNASSDTIHISAAQVVHSGRLLVCRNSQESGVPVTSNTLLFELLGLTEHLKIKASGTKPANVRVSRLEDCELAALSQDQQFLLANTLFTTTDAIGVDFRLIWIPLSISR